LKQFVVIGLGQFGRHTAKTLYSGGADVVAIDRNEGRVERVKDEVGQAICADATDIDVLRTIGVAKADTAVVALGEIDLEASIMVCVALSDLGVARIIVRSATELHGRILSRIGATRIIYPEKQMGEQLALSILAPGVLEQTNLSTGQTVAHIRPRRDLVGKTLRESNLADRYRLAVIAIQKPISSIDDKGEAQEELDSIPVPSLDTVIENDDILVVAGNHLQIEQVSRKD
jgi:trk system potassium uptake protein TrkA